MKSLIYVGLSASLLMACETSKQVTATKPTTAADPLFTTASIDTAFLDTSIKPSDDFFLFANGNWVKNNPVPPSESRWGSFNELDQANKEKIKLILKDALSQNHEKGSTYQLLGAYYQSYINMTGRNILGLSPIVSELDAVKNIKDKKELPELIAIHHRNGIRSLFGFGVGQDLKNVTQHTVNFRQGGIGLPNRDYYLKEDKAQILSAYVQYIVDAYTLLGLNEEEASVRAKQVLNFETSLAEMMMSPAELREPEKTYNKVSLNDFNALTGDFDALRFVKKTGISNFDTLIVGQIDFAKQLGKLYKELPLEDWKAYLHWRVLNHYSGHLNDDFVKLNFKFYGSTLKGQKEMKPIEERAIEELTNIEISELLGKAFVERHFSKEAKDRVNKMVDDLLVVFGERIKQLDWMSQETRQEALKKLESIGRKLGFPEKWNDYSKLELSGREYINNVRNMANYSYEKNIAKLKEAVDKEEWGMPAHMVNAYYHPLLNEIAFPAGIMQAPFFDMNYEDAVNYGRIGMVIGHEFTHGFDDKGSKFAADGSFTNWWAEEDRKRFEEKTDLLGQTYAAFCPTEDHCVNAQLTMGENIADLGGLTLAYHAYKRTEEYKQQQVRHGFTPDQRFFIAYAQLWRINYTPEEMKNRLATDPHSPGMYRVNGPLMNCPEFFEAFQVKEGMPMRNKKEKVAKIW